MAKKRVIKLQWREVVVFDNQSRVRLEHGVNLTAYEIANALSEGWLRVEDQRQIVDEEEKLIGRLLDSMVYEHENTNRWEACGDDED